MMNQPENKIEELEKNIKIYEHFQQLYLVECKRKEANIANYLSFILGSPQYQNILELDYIRFEQINLYYIPIHCRNLGFKPDSLNFCGRLIFYHTHNGKIFYKIILPFINKYDIEYLPIEDDEIIFENNSSDNHEIAKVLIKFINKMNEWEELGINGKFLQINMHE